MNNLENSITFATLHIVHPDIPTKLNSEGIIEQLKLLRKEN